MFLQMPATKTLLHMASLAGGRGRGALRLLEPTKTQKVDLGQGQAYWSLVYSLLPSKDSNEMHGGRRRAGWRADVYDVSDARMEVSVCGT